MEPDPAQPTPNVPQLAAQAVCAVLAGRSLTATLAHVIARYPQLSANERGALWDLSHGALRQLGLLRSVMCQLLRKPIEDRALEALLIVALYQLEFTRAAAYAVVSEAVTSADKQGWPWAKSMVNAVLRRFQRERERLLAAARTEEPGRFSYPQWWIERVRANYPERWQRVLEGGNRQAAMALRVNLRRGTRANYLERLRAEGIEASPFLDAGVLIEHAVPVSRLPGFADGYVSVQDLGAQHAAAFLACEPGQRVLDACAAPGGKTAHLLERTDIEMMALDNDASRIERVEANLRRLGLDARVCCTDAAAVAAWWDGRPYDRILADVPCTGSGVVRRHPDIKWLRRESDIAALAERAARILDALWHVLKPGGRLLFTTCSIFPEENRAQVEDFVARNADAQLTPLPEEYGQDMQLLPDECHDGFYYALLERR